MGDLQQKLKTSEDHPERNTQSASVFMDLGELRFKGNECFQHGDWKGAIQYYSKCIHSALTSNPGISSSKKESMDIIVCCYSNRAEALLKLEEYGKAVEDSDQALQIDSTHLKSIFRKGRALHGLREYNLACSSFELALQRSPAAKEIRTHFEKSKKLNEQNQQGKFDLSACFLNGCRIEDIPEVSNFIGPVIIKKSPVHGRGLFATKDVDIGDTLLVDNAIAVSSIYRKPGVFRIEDSPAPRLIEGFKQDTVEQVASCAMSSPRVLRQLQHLVDSSWLKPAETEIPDMELFRINMGNWSQFNDSCRNLENLHVDTFKLRKAMELNALLTHITQREKTPALNKDGDEHDMWSRSAATTERCGFWALPSFINHSCFPNAKSMVVGKAMFIIAVKGIATGEEITVRYSRCLLPLMKREEYCRQMGFRCECKRCVFERSLGPSYEKLAHTILTKFNWVMRDLSNSSAIIDMQSLVDPVLRLKEIGAQGEEKHFIHASFHNIYSMIFASAQVYPNIHVPIRLLPTKMEVAEAIRHTVPGSYASMEIFRMLLKGAHGQERHLLLQKAMEDGITILGKQKEDVLKAFMASKVDAASQLVFRIYIPETAVMEVM